MFLLNQEFSRVQNNSFVLYSAAGQNTNRKVCSTQSHKDRFEAIAVLTDDLACRYELRANNEALIL